MDAHWQALTDSFTTDQIDSQYRDDGDAEAAVTGTQSVTAEYRAPYLAHAPLEPSNATVLVTDARVDIWTRHANTAVCAGQCGPDHRP